MIRRHCFRLFLLALLLLPLPLTAQAAQPSLDDLMRAGKKSAAAENFQQAIETWQQAKKLYPNSTEPSEALARLYSNRKLFALALEEYQFILTKKPADYETLFNVAETSGLLGQDAQSIRAFEQGLKLYPDDREFIQALAWMYFKAEEYQKGINLLQEAIKARGTNRNYEMTLGTIYSNLYEYELSRRHYTESIRLGLRDGEQYFASIAYYNLSILDVTFYEHARAMESVEASLHLTERPSGHLALGELHQARMDFRKAVEAFEKADSGDDTPLSKFDLASLYAQFGYFELALAYLKKISEQKDESWMYNFGITKEKFQRDLHQLYHQVYEGQAAAADFDSKANPWEWLVWLWKKIQLWLLSWYHGSQFKELQITLAEKSLSTANNPQAWWSLYQANKAYPAAARKYLALARDFELSRTPKALPSYQHETGALEGNLDLLLKAVAGFDPVWQKEEAAETLSDALPLARGRLPEDQNRQLVNALYKINPGALRQHGTSLPLQVNVFGSDQRAAAQAAEALRAFVSACGYDAAEKGRPGVEYTLNLNVGSDGTWRSTLRDGAGSSVFTFARKLEDKEAPAVYFAEMFDKVHSLPENK